MRKRMRRCLVLFWVLVMIFTISGCGRLKKAINAFMEDEDEGSAPVETVISTTEPGNTTENSSGTTDDNTEGNASASGNLNDPGNSIVGGNLNDPGNLNTTPDNNTSNNTGTTDENTVILNQVTEKYCEFLLPEGWLYSVYADAATDITFYAYDPKNPDMGFYYLYGIGPFLKDANAANYFTDPMFTTAIPFTEQKMDQLYLKWNDFLKYANSRGALIGYPVMNNVQIVNREAESTALASIALDEGILTITYDNAKGNACKGKFSGTLFSLVDQQVGTVNCGLYGIYNACGIMAPADQFDAYFDMMQTCLNSFTLTQEYIDFHDSNQ